jgi:hypothetical protein
MSGSAVYAEDGSQLGIVVRASFSDTDAQYVRAVRMSYVVALVERALAALSTAEQRAVHRFLPPL